MMDDVATPIIDPQEIPRGEMMNKSDDKIFLPERISEPDTNGGVLDRINKRSNLKLVGKKGLWFSFGEQLMRFSLREFHLAKGLPCVVDKDEEEVETSATKIKKNQTLNTLLNLLVKKSTELTADQRLRLGATILVEGILMASNPCEFRFPHLPEERLLRARNFKEFCKYPRGNLAFDYLRKEVESFTYTKNDEIQFPLCLHWIETKSLTIEEVDVKCILGDPELHSDLVEDVDSEVDENNSAPGIDATDQEKIEFLTKKYLEGLLNIRGETVNETEKSKETEAATKTKVNGQNADYELDETKVLQDYIDAKR
ncbi:BnaC05g44720D [Brassica napus]|uniref:BnaC05g44720D protein n=1 Tax=Brassica napus TaxID=3708 RepID=A0A078GNG7_BRANA|nr:BnaC05g44720D [Brassica napus]